VPPPAITASVRLRLDYVRTFQKPPPEETVLWVGRPGEQRDVEWQDLTDVVLRGLLDGTTGSQTTR
jgi:hypothetical protein